MKGWDLGALARAAEADIRGGALPVSVAAVGTDTRSLPPASLFVALRGERFDGHDFLAQAVAAGARALLVDSRASLDPTLLAKVPCLVVADTLRALGNIAAWSRTSHGRPVVAVTGSNGKTTTKELVAAALGGRGPVHKTQGNLNNLIGVPLTLLAWGETGWAGVIEMGMNVPGEIARLTEITAPNVGLITQVAAAHLAGLGSVEGVARAKGELFAGLPADSTAVVNVDDPLINQICVPLAKSRRLIRYGWGESADVRVLSARTQRQGGALSLAVELSVHGARQPLTLPLAGRHNASNAAAAVAAALALGLPPSQSLPGLAHVVVPGGRLRLLADVPPGVHILDDSYNANPGSMRAALETLTDAAAGGRRFAVLGDMKELGAESAALHRKVGGLCAGCTALLAFGPEAPSTVDGARAVGVDAEAFTDLEALVAALRARLRAGDWLLVKGSRSMGMERVVEALSGRPGKGH